MAQAGFLAAYPSEQPLPGPQKAAAPASPTEGPSSGGRPSSRRWALLAQAELAEPAEEDVVGDSAAGSAAAPGAGGGAPGRAKGRVTINATQSKMCARVRTQQPSQQCDVVRIS